MNANTRCARAAAEEYAREAFLLVDFQVGNTNLSDAEAARIFETIAEELAKAWLAGCEAANDPQEAA